MDEKKTIVVRPAEEMDLSDIITIGVNAFPNDFKDRDEAAEWIMANYKAYPRIQYFVAEEEGKILGYASWMYIGGFRSGVIELDQIGVHSDARGKGLGKLLLIDSFEDIKRFSKEDLEVKIRLVKISTATTNKAKAFYEKNIGAKEEVVIKDYFYGEDEALLFRRFDKDE
ncbi:GNAT family N-acetyltransferase [Patescibacteria group bacterium]|nr:GNAT family N-acetyltransferase [Patescibacteria group bacterium]